MATKQSNNKNNGNNRRVQPSNDTTFNYIGKALWYPLNKVEYEEAKNLYPNDKIMLALDKILDSGYGLSVKPNGDEGIKVSFLGYSGDNTGLMLSVIASTFTYAVRCLLYRHNQYYEGTWRTYEDEYE